MKRNLKSIRDWWLYENWEKHKTFLSMEELGIIFNIPTSTVYRVIRKQTKEQKQK